DPKHKSTLVHCGYRYGSPGTGVATLQLDATRAVNPPESEWMSELVRFEGIRAGDSLHFAFTATPKRPVRY
ncbi:hypothetical protein SERLADRAFT_393670, partial [Serpula lacrymans var. lacrymans S7.9]